MSSKGSASGEKVDVSLEFICSLLCVKVAYVKTYLQAASAHCKGAFWCWLQSLSVAEYSRQFFERVTKGHYSESLEENRKIAGQNFICTLVSSSVLVLVLSLMNPLRIAK